MQSNISKNLLIPILTLLFRCLLYLCTEQTFALSTKNVKGSNIVSGLRAFSIIVCSDEYDVIYESISCLITSPFPTFDFLKTALTRRLRGHGTIVIHSLSIITILESGFINTDMNTQFIAFSTVIFCIPLFGK